MSALEKAFDLLRNSPAATVDTRKRRKPLVKGRGFAPQLKGGEQLLPRCEREEVSNL